MGKVEEQHLQQQQQIQRTPPRRVSGLFCERCSVGLGRIGKEFNFKCVAILILGVAVFLSAIFWILPRPEIQSSFDAKQSIKLSATIQAYFKLEKPVSMLVPRIGRLEYDIFGEIAIPDTEVAILSMHQTRESNFTEVVFGVLSDPRNVSINLAYLSVLKSSFIDLFLQQSNLTLTTTIFGQPSSFDILKFPGGITLVPETYAPFWLIPQILFNFTLNNSISDIQNNFIELKEQLKFGLHLRPYENVYVQVTNKDGSTRYPPVTVQAAITSDRGILPPQRLKQLAQIITGSPPTKNLGLDNSVFGEVREIILSSYLNRTIHSTPPSPSPSPSPTEQNDEITSSNSPNPAPSPYSPISSPDFHHPWPSPVGGPYHSLPPVSNPPAPVGVTSHPPSPCPYQGSIISPSSSPVSHSVPTPASTISPSPVGPTSQFSPDLSPFPVASYASRPGQDKGSGKVSAFSTTFPYPILTFIIMLF